MECSGKLSLLNKNYQKWEYYIRKKQANMKAINKFIMNWKLKQNRLLKYQNL